ncbi:NAD(P)-dependent alcohol dehydrogenase [Nonomuraea roseoviolacea subsp. roseoviolacea]|uniref:NADPH:quinone reductase-like Zn-dependent oxidoreductase n=1 Tax=Nonomuraea roseoviolacea subsp. carminata TaxID=160689 RepID=A0ABT1JZW6_9ACTN|nr:NAD(P)-dependent alcohol dehydrogenase [Nonomuraea roseoviolacea]MCP2347140.1 NADPH:quinone reductase-like Zn-dependent oxidoreductase [Nonomuraea roseoviolacea subsp. carminata]
MRSYHLQPGRGLDGLTTAEHDEPTPGRGQVVVRMRANGLGFRDLLVLNNDYPLPITPGIVPGCEGVGDVVSVGEDVTRVKPGDRVAATVFPQWQDGPFLLENAAQLGTMVDGMLTEYAVLGEDGVVPIPEHLSYEEAAALPLAAVTAWNALTSGGVPRPGETVLTLGSGGVSLFTLMFAKAGGARVIATTSGPAKAARLRELGADEVIDYRVNPSWSEEVRALTNGRGADRVVDPAGPLEESLRSVALGGEVAFVGYRLSGAQGAAPVNPAVLFGAGAVVRPVATGSRAHFLQVNRVMAAHRLRPVIDRVFSFEDVHEAYRYCMAGGGFGKVVISHG